MAGAAAIYAKMREAFLKENFPEMYNELKDAGELQAHLKQTGAEAEEEEMFETLQSQMATDPKVQALPFQEKVEAFRRIPSTVRELVEEDLIYNPPRGRTSKPPNLQASQSPTPTAKASLSPQEQVAAQQARKAQVAAYHDMGPEPKHGTAEREDWIDDLYCWTDASVVPMDWKPGDPTPHRGKPKP